jgi:hypothetical protein
MQWFTLAESCSAGGDKYVGAEDFGDEGDCGILVELHSVEEFDQWLKKKKVSWRDLRERRGTEYCLRQRERRLRGRRAVEVPMGIKTEK